MKDICKICIGYDTAVALWNERCYFHCWAMYHKKSLRSIFRVFRLPGSEYNALPIALSVGIVATLTFLLVSLAIFLVTRLRRRQ